MDMRGVGGGESAAGSFSYANLAPPERKQYSHRQNDDGSFLSASQMMDSGERDPVSGGSKPKATVRYRECLKNHAANIGGNVVDGCGEFMPTGEEGSLEALKCAACDCHRNFHRKEVDGETQFSSSCRRRTMMVPLPFPLPSPTASLHHHHQFSMGFHGGNSTATTMVQPMNVAFGGGGSGGTESSSEDLNAFHSNHNNNNADGGSTVPAPPYALQKKRSRTKFTAEQKSKMLEFAEKVGWRFQRQEEEEIERFCAEVGVKRQVFKVWMHNNKNIIAMKKQEAGSTDHAATTL